jgi:single-strand DNA-binding protein
MPSLNKAEVMGFLGNDPVIRFTADNKPVANLSLASTERWRDRNTGEMKEKTEWHRIVLRDRLAEIARDYLFKGSCAYIAGKLQTRKWTDKDGIERYTTEILGNNVQLLSKQESLNAPPPGAPASEEPPTHEHDEWLEAFNDAD